MRESRKYVFGAILLALSVMAAACGGSGGDGNEGSAGDGEAKGSLTVGSESFPEAQIVGEMYAQVLENAGYSVDRQLDLQSREVRLPEMESGNIHVSPEYVASLLAFVDEDATASDLDGGVAALEEPLSAMGLEILEPSDAVDTNAFVVTPDVAEEFNLTSVSDLQAVASDMTLGGPAECPDRPFCIPGLKDVYDVEFGDFKSLEYGAATSQALTAGAIDVALLFSTDPLIAENNLVVLEDDKGLQAADNITPLINTAGVDTEARGLLDAVSAALTTEGITALNARVAVDLEDPEDVAREFLEEQGLL
ncbi:MAG: ABC transporter substrate-binding protein [Actinomycetota bacterium]